MVVESRAGVAQEPLEWWYLGDKQVGPIGQEELEALIREKVIGANTLVWSPGMPEWAPLCDVPGR